MSLLKALFDPKKFLLHVEMCPPRMDLPLEQSVDAWIDSNQLMRKITSLGRGSGGGRRAVRSAAASSTAQEASDGA